MDARESLEKDVEVFIDVEPTNEKNKFCFLSIEVGQLGRVLGFGLKLLGVDAVGNR